MEEYWHMGETTIRLRRLTPRMERGSRRVIYLEGSRMAADARRFTRIHTDTDFAAI